LPGEAALARKLAQAKRQTYMDAACLYYITGEEVHAGDRVQHKGNYATVVFVSTGESEEFAPGFEEHTGSERGVMLCDDDGGTEHIGEPGEMLTFIDRG
jgi:hypothetical protein